MSKTMGACGNEPILSVSIYVPCSWCHNSVSLGVKYCPQCGHRADLPRFLCDCPRCRGRCVICHQSYNGGRELTCSNQCHGKLVKQLIAEFGEYKKVVRQSTGIAYRVPTRDIIQKGLKGEELGQYPRWVDENHA